MDFKKVYLVAEREFKQRVFNKKFLITTLIVPLIMMCFYGLVIFIGSKEDVDKNKKMLVVDPYSFFATEDFSKLSMVYVYNDSINESTALSLVEKGIYDYACILPDISKAEARNKVKFLANDEINIEAKDAIEPTINAAIQEKKFEMMEIENEVATEILSEPNYEYTILKNGEKSGDTSTISYIIGMISGIFIYMLTILYGVQVMRGVSEEKTSRIAEIIVSSLKPIELMLGKIFGIGMVGLTQIIIWMVMGSIITSIASIFIGDMMAQEAMKQASAKMPSQDMTQINTLISSIFSVNWAFILPMFIFYFLCGYMMYASLFATIGSMVGDDASDSQSLSFVVTMPIVLGFVIMMQAVKNPDSTLAIIGSLVPLTSPIVMMSRLPSGVPFWQLVVSMSLLIGAIFLFAWASGRIYRATILMYGKKTNWGEALKYLMAK
jgi:ABC-2 type transport system permease protein